jgi:prepilin-type N-terminal cleavage/methylation domain-containing protein
MNKKGFTLVELLAVIVILGVLLSLVVMSVNTYLKKAKETSLNSLIKSIEETSEIYLSDHSSEYPQLNVVGSSFTFELEELVDNNYIKKPVIDDVKGENIPLTTLINVTVVSDSEIKVDFLYE